MPLQTRVREGRELRKVVVFGWHMMVEGIVYYDLNLNLTLVYQHMVVVDKWSLGVHLTFERFDDAHMVEEDKWSLGVRFGLIQHLMSNLPYSSFVHDLVGDDYALIEMGCLHASLTKNLWY